MGISSFPVPALREVLSLNVVLGELAYLSSIEDLLAIGLSWLNMKRKKKFLSQSEKLLWTWAAPAKGNSSESMKSLEGLVTYNHLTSMGMSMLRDNSDKWWG